MEYKFLPEKVKSSLKAAEVTEQPKVILRSSGSLNGQPGESYLIAYPDMLYILSRQLGSSDYELLKGDYAEEIADMAITNVANGDGLQFKLDTTNYQLKFAEFDRPAANEIIKLWKAKHLSSAAEEKGDPAAAGETAAQHLSPFAALAAGMMYIAGSDNKIVDCEEYYIRQVYSGRKADLREGVEFYQQHDFTAFCRVVKSFTPQQKLCILANMLDLAMSDGILHTCEQSIVQGFIDASGLDKEEAGRIIDALEIKNHTANLIESTDNNE